MYVLDWSNWEHATPSSVTRSCWHLEILLEREGPAAPVLSDGFEWFLYLKDRAASGTVNLLLKDSSVVTYKCEAHNVDHSLFATEHPEVIMSWPGAASCTEIAMPGRRIIVLSGPCECVSDALKVHP